MVDEAFAFVGSFKGSKVCRIEELGSLADDQLAKVRPIIKADCEIFVDESHVCYRTGKTVATVQLFPNDKVKLRAIDFFDGEHSIGQISDALSQEMDLEQAHGFDSVRETFLSLVSQLICVPRDPLDSDE
jgi:hypothetical protein